MEVGLVLRDFVRRDQEHVRQLVLDGLRQRWGQIDESLNPDLDDIAAAYGDGRTVVAEIGGVVVGTGTLVPVDASSAEIVRMAVASSSRRRGVGRLIVGELVGTARQWGAARVVLETTDHWTDAVAFYGACGFEITHVTDGRFGRAAWFARDL